jgi:cytosine permease
MAGGLGEADAPTRSPAALHGGSRPGGAAGTLRRPPAPKDEPVRSSDAAWYRSAGAYVGIGSAPAALVLGVGLAGRHGGAPSVWALLLGTGVVAVLLYAQGLLGMQPPVGGGASFSEVARGYLGRRSLTGMNVLLLAAMIGWFGFNVALGGTALAALVGVPPAVGAGVLGGVTTAIALGGMRRWNWFALGATAGTLVLLVLVQARLGAWEPPLTVGTGRPGALLFDVAAFIGYAAVFALRAPDFTAPLRRRRSLVACVASLVVPLVFASLVGVAVHLRTGTEDIVGLLAGSGSLAVGNLLIAIGVVAPILASTHSGRYAAQGLGLLRPGAATAAVAVPGLALALLRFDLYLQPWLVLQAAILPPLIVPMALEGTRRRRGRDPRPVPLWTWVPGAVAGLLLLPALPGAAAAVGLLVAAGATALWLDRTRRLDRTPRRGGG